jgi:hypothetical protein
MLPTVIYLIEAIRRAMKNAGRNLSIFADAFDEAIDQSDAARRKYPLAD